MSLPLQNKFVDFVQKSSYARDQNLVWKSQIYA